jgi:hypothetical protein
MTTGKAVMRATSADSFRFLQAVLLREEPFRAKLYGPLNNH